MAVTTPPPGTETEEHELKDVEQAALEHLTAEEGRVELELEAAAVQAVEELPQEMIPWRLLIATTLSTLSAAMLAGGIFRSSAPRIYMTVAGLLGAALAAGVYRLRRPLVTYVLIVGGLFVIGLIAVIPFGSDHLFSLRNSVTDAVGSGKLLRPPVDFTAGWAAITSWIMGTVGFGSAWMALSVRKPSLGVMLPLPLAAIAGISVVGRDTQIGSGLAAVALFGAALGMLAGSQLGETGDEGLPLRYEIRRGIRSFLVMAFVTVLLYFAAQTNFLFPHPLYDPTLQPQKPKPVSLSNVVDKVLFEISDSRISGPWVVGVLDVYDGQDWRLPPFAENQLHEVPRDGRVDANLKPGERATFTIRGLSGTVLPSLPDSVGILASGTKLDYDARSGNIRLVEGQVQPGFTYTVVAAATPAIEDLTALGVHPPVPVDIEKFKQIGPPPAAVQDLIRRAPATSKWEEFDYLRNWVLQNVVATGLGTPVSVTPDRVQEILTRKEGSPLEIVATQAMLGRWAGLPVRIGYGFDGGEKVGNHLEVHPRNGSAFPEVYFSGFSWVPVIGVPVHAKASESNNVTQTNPSVLPSKDIAVLIYIPEVTSTSPPIWEQLRPLLLIAAVVLAVALLIYFGIPVLRKGVRRARARGAAARAGTRAEIAQAYAEWRDHATDFGYAFPSDTPLMFVERFIPDEEHTQFAWLVTRALWGDLGGQLKPELATGAKELSRTLRQRLSQARPITVRAVALVSRLSLRHPYEAPAHPAAAAALQRSAA